MKRRLVFLSRQQASLLEIADMLKQPHLQGWRLRVFTRAIGDVQRMGLPVASPLMLTNMMGGAWRGGFWGTALGLLLFLIVMPLFDIEEGLVRNIILYSLPTMLLFFGAWEGGLLGLMQDNDALADYQDAAAEGLFVLLVDVQDVDQRLLKKIMAMCDAEQIGEHTQRMWGFPWRENIYVKAEELAVVA
ncbi:hypothetical protein [Zhongshania sp. BJYM1]|uniref:hypothetical protein n=1 Tax=Zhongshania aquatica TaxID=2965069 RepID=UPI0022B2D96C|nr:hypothetical protein [Marortus sp. BJYM1]